MSRFLYFYTMRDAGPDRIREVVESHVSYWRSQEFPDYLGGPFSDRTGGLITFGAATLDRARDTVAQDPFVKKGLVERSWVKEWIVE